MKKVLNTEFQILKIPGITENAEMKEEREVTAGGVKL